MHFNVVINQGWCCKYTMHVPDPHFCGTDWPVFSFAEIAWKKTSRLFESTLTQLSELFSKTLARLSSRKWMLDIQPPDIDRVRRVFFGVKVCVWGQVSKV